MERRGERERQREERTKKKTLPAFPEEEGHVLYLFISAVAPISICV